jgi:hypothetical protein
MHVAELWRYPVKSMIGTTMPSVELDALGVVGDRRWATRDLRRGGIRGAKKLGALMRFAARDAGGIDAVITCPDGTELHTADRDVHDRLSAALDHPVRLEALRPADDLEHYRRGGPDHDDIVAELRAVFGRNADEPLPDLGSFPPVIYEYESPPGTYYDVHPLLVVTTAALRSLASAVPESNVDVRRVRPSIVVDTDEPGYPELEWRGRSARLGTAQITFVGRCPRCVMVTRQIGLDVPEDRAVLRYIVRQLDQDFGQYAVVTTPGVVTAGDAVTFVD